MSFYRNFLNLLEAEMGSKTAQDSPTNPKNTNTNNGDPNRLVLELLKPFLHWESDKEGVLTPILCLEKLLPIPKELEAQSLPDLPRIPNSKAFQDYQIAHHSLEQDNLTTYGVRNLQEWITKNWGTNSNQIQLQIHQKLGSLILEFQTQNAPPTSIVAALKEKTGRNWGLVFEAPTE